MRAPDAALAVAHDIEVAIEHLGTHIEELRRSLTPFAGDTAVGLADVVNHHIVACAAGVEDILAGGNQLGVGAFALNPDRSGRATHVHAVVDEEAGAVACALEELFELAFKVRRVDDIDSRLGVAPVGHVDEAFAVDAQAERAADQHAVAVVAHAVDAGPVGIVGPDAVALVGLADAVRHVDAAEIVAFGAHVHGVANLAAIVKFAAGIVIQAHDAGNLLAHKVHGPVHLLIHVAGEFIVGERDGIFSFFHVGNFHFSQYFAGLFVGEDEFGALGVTVGSEVEGVLLVAFGVGQAISVDALDNGLLNAFGGETRHLVAGHEVHRDVKAVDLGAGCHVGQGGVAFGTARCRSGNFEVGTHRVDELGVVQAIGHIKELHACHVVVVDVGRHHHRVACIFEEAHTVRHVVEHVGGHLAHDGGIDVAAGGGFQLIGSGALAVHHVAVVAQRGDHQLLVYAGLVLRELLFSIEVVLGEEGSRLLVAAHAHQEQAGGRRGVGRGACGDQCTFGRRSAHGQGAAHVSAIPVSRELGVGPLHGVAVQVIPFVEAQCASLFAVEHIIVVDLAQCAVHAHQLVVGCEGDVAQAIAEAGIVGLGRCDAVHADLLDEFFGLAVDQIDGRLAIVLGEHHQRVAADDGAADVTFHGIFSGLLFEVVLVGHGGVSGLLGVGIVVVGHRGGLIAFRFQIEACIGGLVGLHLIHGHAVGNLLGVL